jgi:uncharacterized protein (TIGR02453 family)
MSSEWDPGEGAAIIRHMPGPQFTARTLTFLRSLKRNNDRDWFKARKGLFEREVRVPMVTVIEQLDRDFRTFAPGLVASPRVSLYRMYRDTRFSEDKSPLKTHIAAVFPCDRLPRNASPALYLEVNPAHVLVAGGLYAPDTAQLRAVRLYLASNIARFRSIVEAPAFKRVAGGLQGDRLQRVPRGFDAAHPAAEYLKHRQFLAWREFPAGLATTSRFYPTVLNVFRVAAPLVLFLCAALADPGAPSQALRS